MSTPRDFYGYFPELELIEVGRRAAFAYDESSTLEHRLCRANGLTYGCPPRHWRWGTLTGTTDGATVPDLEEK